MLVEFSVKNFLSFKERTTFSMVASSDKSLPGNVIYNAQGTGLNLLKTAAIYGANASGKSNFIAAMDFFIKIMFDSNLAQITPLGEEIPTSPFYFDDSCSMAPSEFEMVFLVNGVRYQCGITLNKSQILEEWLYSYPKGKRRTLFHIHRVDGGVDSYFGPSWKGHSKVIMDLVKPTSSFLSVASGFQNDTALSLGQYFLSSLSMDPGMNLNKVSSVILYLLNDDYRASAEKFIRLADSGIQGLYLDEDDVNTIRMMMSKIVENMKPGGYDKQQLGDLSNVLKDIDIYSLRRGFDGGGNEKTIRFKFSNESDGTKKLLILFCASLPAFHNMKPLTVDELDAQMHPHLAKYFIELFQGKEGKTEEGQLIFTTHAPHLLDQSFIRRDQVWFTEKNKEGATEMYSLWDFKNIRKDENIRNGYLAGKYGGVPFLDDFSNGGAEHVCKE